MKVVGSRHPFKSIKYSLLGISPGPREPVSYAAPGAEWTETDTVQYLRQTRLLAQSIIQRLASMTDLAQKPVEMPQIRSGMSVLPDISATRNQLLLPHNHPSQTVSEQVRKLTAFDYGAESTEKITHLFYKLLKQGQQRPPLDVVAFNALIGYFLALNDWQMATHSFNKMLDTEIRPNRATFHLILQFLAARVRHCPYPSGLVGHPLLGTRRCLSIMNRHGVRADSTTWNWVLQCMPFGFGKSFLVEEMDRRGIPLNSESRRVILETIVEDRKARDGKFNGDNELVPQLLVESLDPRDPAVVQYILDYILSQRAADNANVRRAYDFWLASDLADVDKRSLAILKTWLRRLAARRHLDWQFGVMAEFRGVQWDSECWQYLLECASFLRESASKYVVLGTLLKEMERQQVPLTSRSRYLARRALKRAASENFKLRDMEYTGFATLVEGLQWQTVFEPKRPELLATIGFGTNTGSTHHDLIESCPITSLDESRFAAVPRTDTSHRHENLIEFLHCT